MNIALISAMSRNRVIGYQGKMPWHLPADLKHFKATTLSKPIIMGRKTFESIGSKPLPQRHNIVLSRQTIDAPGCTVVASAEEALAVAGSEQEIMIIGGETLYRLFMPLARRIYLTLIDEDFTGDTFFPEIDGSWETIEEQSFQADEKNPFHYKFILLERQ